MKYADAEDKDEYMAENVFFDDQHPTLKADFIMANPPFNLDKWGQDRLFARSHELEDEIRKQLGNIGIEF